jgi:hypothetical protein
MLFLFLLLHVHHASMFYILVVSPAMDWLTQVVIPFSLSAAVVIIITLVAERYGTKVGGIIGTLPTNLAVAMVFIGINRGAAFAADAAVVVPAEMGINILFLAVFSVVAYRSLPFALTVSLGVWAVLSAGLYLGAIENVWLSLAIYLALMIPSFLFLELWKKVPSRSPIKVHYTWQKILFRGLLAGAVIAIAVLLSNVGAAISGIFSVFPAIFTSTMTIFVYEHGARFAGAMAKSMMLGSLTTVGFSVAVHLLYPELDIGWGTLAAYAFSFVVVLAVSWLSRRIS